MASLCLDPAIRGVERRATCRVRKSHRGTAIIAVRIRPTDPERTTATTIGPTRRSTSLSWSLSPARSWWIRIGGNHFRSRGCGPRTTSRSGRMSRSSSDLNGERLTSFALPQGPRPPDRSRCAADVGRPGRRFGLQGGCARCDPRLEPARSRRRGAPRYRTGVDRQQHAGH